MFAFPAASLALPAARSTVTDPFEVGVTVNVYVVPDPESADLAPLPTDTPASEKPVTGSENVAVTVNAAFVGFEELDVRATVGAAVSSVIVAVAVVDALPAASLYCTQTVFVPSPAESVSEVVAEYEVVEVTAVHEAAEQSLPSAAR